MSGLRKFESAVLESLYMLNESDEFCDLEVQCGDGTLSVPGLIFAALSPVNLRCNMSCFNSHCLVLPDIACSEFLFFLRSLLNPHVTDLDQEKIQSLYKISSLLGLNILLSLYSDDPTVELYEDCVVDDADEPEETIHESSQQLTESNEVAVSEMEMSNMEEMKNESTQKETSETERTQVEETEIEPVHVEETEIESIHVEETEIEPVNVEETEIEPVNVEETETEPVQIEETETEPAHVEETEMVEVDAVPRESLKNSRFLENLISESTTKYSDLDNLCIFFDEKSAVLGQKCLLNLAKVDIDTVVDEVLTENFCDQEGRLVCLVCYKIMGPSEFQSYRDHLKDHDARQLEKVSIIMPGIGKGGPGLKKKVMTDTELDFNFLNESGDLFECDKCSKKFVASDKAAFRKHLHYHAHKEKKYVYQCTECYREFNDASNLKRHIQSVHEKQLFRCLHCDFEDRRKHKLEDHLLCVHKDKVLIYDEVSLNKGQVLSDLTEPLPLLNAGQSVELTNNPYLYKCSVCNYKKRRLEDVDEHVRESHDETATVKKIALKPREPNKVLHKCSVCPEVFSKHSTLNQHKLAAHDIEYVTEFSCRYCDVNCGNKPGLRAHERTHLDKKFSCNTCKKSFLLLHLLKDHVEKGVCKQENRTCDVCNKVFRDRVRRDIHMKIHTKEKAFHCTTCGKSFTQKRSLKEHSLVHDTKRHFQCSLCNKQFVQNNHLKYHQYTQHPNAFPDSTKHTCQLCSKSFPYFHQLKRHLRVHGSQGSGTVAKSALRCGHCSNWFPSPTLLRNHLERCTMSFPTSSNTVDDDMSQEDMIVSVDAVETLENSIDIDIR